MLGSHALLSLLIDEGVTHLFGNPGTTELPLMAALPDFPQIDYVLGAQEAAVVAMADGFARASGCLAACNLHVAPGLGNAIGSLFNASWIGSPLLVTAGQHPIGHGLTEPMLYAPLEPMARPHVKWAVEATRLDDLPRIVRRAAKIALAPPTGPVFISLPGNVLTDDVEVDLGRCNRVEARVRPADAVLDALADRLLAARSPVMVVGHEVNTRSALPGAAELAELLGAGVYQDTIPTAAPFVSSHPCFLGMLSRNQRDVAERLGAHDLLLCLGTDVLRMSVPGPPPLPPGMPVVQVGERSADLARNYPTELAVQADVRETLAALNERLRARRPAGHEAAARQRIEELRPGNWSAAREAFVRSLGSVRTGKPIHPDHLMRVLSDTLPADAVVVDEGLTSSAGAAPAVALSRRAQLLRAGQRRHRVRGGRGGGHPARGAATGRWWR